MRYLIIVPSVHSALPISISSGKASGTADHAGCEKPANGDAVFFKKADKGT
jgi:hypothetical protein